MNIAIVAQDSKKELMIQFCTAYLAILNNHVIYATGNTGKKVEEATGLKIQKFLTGKQGGEQQIAARVACNEIDLLLFFREPIAINYANSNDLNLLNFCDMHNIPVATNIATAEILIRGLKKGDLEWRNILNSK